MIIPRDEAEAKKFEALVKKNEEAEDWVAEDPSFSPLSVPKNALTILEKVGSHKLPSKK